MRRAASSRRDARRARAAAPGTVRRLTNRSDAAGALQLIGHALALALTGTLVAATDGAIARTLAMAVHGLVLVFLFAALHETTHGTAFRSGWINRAVAQLCGLLLVLPPRYFRAFHLGHHRHTQDPDRDPELAAGPPGRVRDYLWRMSGLGYWAERIGTLWRHARGSVTEPYLSEHERITVRREARLYAAIYLGLGVISLAAGSPALLWLWLLPALLGQPWLRLFLFAEHADCPYTPDMLVNSRTTHTHALARWLTWNMCFHAEHHACAAVPFHALPDAHALLAPGLATTSRGYWRVHRSWLAAR